jgi:hypothetical protein
MFQEEKQAIDDDPNSVRFRREKLASGISEWRPGDSCAISFDINKVASRKKRIANDFKKSLAKSPFNIQTYKQIDQGREGACTLVSLMHLIHINRLDEEIHSLGWTSIKKVNYWRQKIWYPIEESVSYIMYYADMLDAGRRLAPIKKVIRHPKFRYVPIRGDGNRELMTNALFFTQDKLNGAKKRFGIETVKNNPITTAVGHFIESQLDVGNVVGVAFNGHARVVVAYNQTHILFADSWGQTIDRDHANDELYVGGVSVVPKYNVYAYTRDLIYFEMNSAAKILAGTNAKILASPAPSTPPQPHKKTPAKKLAAPQKTPAKKTKPAKNLAAPQKTRRKKTPAKKLKPAKILATPQKPRRKKTPAETVCALIQKGKHAGETWKNAKISGTRVYNGKQWAPKTSVKIINCS